VRYVSRDIDGNINRVVTEPEGDATEAIYKEDPELIAFITEGGGEPALRAYLATSDAELLQVLEDLVNVLIEKNVILLSDFPDAAQRKLMHRLSVRKKIQTY
jgi:hypothetical protein